MQAEGGTATPRLRVQAGEPFAVTIGDGEQRWRASSTLLVREDGMADMQFVLQNGARTVGTPRLVAPLGEQAAIRVDDAYRLALTVTRAE